MAKTTKNVGNKSGETAENNTNANAEPGGAGPGSSQVAQGPQTVDPELAGAKGEFDGALARRPQDVQTEEQFNAGIPAGGLKDRNEVQEWIETGPGQVQSTKPVNEPA